MSVRPSAWENQAPTGRIFIKFDIWVFFENLSRKIQVSLKSNFTFLKIISRSILLRRGNVSDKICRENKKAHFIFSEFFFSFENRAVYQVMWKNTIPPGSPQKTVRRLRVDAEYLGLQTHTFGICSTYCITAKTMVARTRLNVTLCTLAGLSFFKSKFICLFSTTNRRLTAFFG